MIGDKVIQGVVAGGEGDPTPQDYIAYYPLTGTAEDVTGDYDGTENSATYVTDTTHGSVFSGTGSITIPSTGGSYCTYWKDTGSGWVHIDSSTIPNSLSTDKYSRLRVYGRTPSVQEIEDIFEYEKSTHHIPVDDGLIAYYPLDNNSMDNYYNQYDGTDTNMSYDGTYGNFGGASSFIQTAYKNSTNNINTVSMWIDTNALGTTEYFLFMTQLGNWRTDLSCAGNGSTSISSTANAININHVDFNTSVVHIIVEIDSSANVVKYWANKVYVGQTSYSPYDQTGNELGMRLGRSGGGYYYYGDMSNTRVYERILTTEEKDAIYDAELAEHS